MEELHCKKIQLNLVTVCAQVPEVGSLILGQLSILDLYNLGFVSKQFKEIVRNYGHWKKNNWIKIISTQPAKVSKEISFNVQFGTKDCGGCINVWNALPSTTKQQWLCQGLLYDLTNQNVPQYDLCVIRDHLIGLGKPQRSWEICFPLTSFITQKGKIAVWLGSPPMPEIKEYLLLLHELEDGALFDKHFFSFRKDQSIFELHSLMAVLVQKKGTNSTKEMCVEVLVYYSHENFSWQRKLYEINCTQGNLHKCVIMDKVIAFSVLSEETGSKEWFRLSLSGDLSSVKDCDKILDSESCLDWLDPGHAYCSLEENVLLYFHYNGQRREVSLDVDHFPIFSSKNCDGDLALIYYHKEEEVTGRVIVLFDQMGNKIWYTKIGEEVFYPSSIALLGELILIMSLESHLYVYDTKWDRVAKHIIWPNEHTWYQDLLIHKNKIIATAKSKSENNGLMLLKCWSLE